MPMYNSLLVLLRNLVCLYITVLGKCSIYRNGLPKVKVKEKERLVLFFGLLVLRDDGVTCLSLWLFITRFSPPTQLENVYCVFDNIVLVVSDKIRFLDLM